MLKYSYLFILVLCCSFFIQSCSTGNSSGKELDIYLLIGQSNMAGRASIAGSDKDTLQNVYLYTGTSGFEWEKAANPLNKYSTIRKDSKMQKLGPGYHFAKAMAAASSKKSIGLVVNAKGGTKIELWAPGGAFYKQAVSRTKAAMEYGTLKGILWHQGEANVLKYKEYPTQISKLVEALRTDFNRPNLPVVLGQLSEDKAIRKNFNQMLLRLPETVNYLGIATSEGTCTKEGTHFNAEGQKIMGERFAKEMQRLLQR